MNMTSNLSNRVKMRRNPFNLLNSRSTSFRFLYNSLSCSQGSTRLLFGGTTGEKPSSERDQLSRLISFVCLVHDHRTWLRCRSQLHQQPAAFRGIPGLSRRKRKYYCVFGSCGNHMKFCCPAAARFADRLRSVFFKAPVPSG